MRSLVCAVTIMLLGGCAYDVADRYYATGKYPAKPTDQVEILTSEPTRKYEVIADFQSKGESADSLRRKAADIGADAVIVSELGGYVPGWNDRADDKTYGRIFNNRIVGTAIRYK